MHARTALDVAELDAQPRRGNHVADPASARPRDRAISLLILAALLASFAAVAIGPSLNLPFIGDDYVFLNKTRTASFASLWSPTTSVDFGWYRPWARELNFWLLQKCFGLNATAYRGMNVVVWISVLCLYAAIVRRLASRTMAAVATLGVATLALWGTPLLWISGSQDLWMLVFVLLSFWWFMRGHPLLALPSFALGLLSKETAAVLPLLLCAYLLIMERQSIRRILRRTSLFWGTLVIWAILHPTLRVRLLGSLCTTPETEARPALPLLLLKTTASCVNLHRLPRPQELDAAVVGSVLLSGLVLAGGAWLAAQKYRTDPLVADGNALARLAGAWALIGWAPLLFPSIGWHAYYGCVGTMGVWLGLALLLETRTVIAVIAIAVMAVLRGAQANTVSSDWGDATYIQSAGSTLAAIRADLKRQHPVLPPHSRVYVAHLPFRIGLIAGNSPALRVWYADSTLEAGYYSYYRPRGQGAAQGQDYFFRFDSTAGMVEVKTGEEDVGDAIRANPRWEEDHDGLAVLFLERGDMGRAAGEFEKVSLLTTRPRAAVYAAVCRRVLGDSARAESLFNAAQGRLHASPPQMKRLVARIEYDVLESAGGR